MASTYTTTAGDTWDLIAYKLFGNERYMKNLIEANLQLTEILRFDAGTVITVPQIPAETNRTLPFWHSTDDYAWAEEAT